MKLSSTIRRPLTTLCLLLSAVCCLLSDSRAEKQAALVGVSEYPFLAGRRHPGIKQDVEAMRLSLELAHFAPANIRSLMDAAAKRTAIRAALAAMASQAQSGDVLVFYFAGRGSLGVGLPAAADGGLTPTLVPADGNKSDAAKDISLDELAAWAEQVAAQGATPVIIVDASYYIKRLREMGQAPTHNPDARSLGRPGKPRRRLWNGPTQSVFLSAANYDGDAYEWKTLSGVGDAAWAGCFTDTLTNLFAGGVQDGAPISPRKLADECAAAFRGVANLPNFLPFPQPEQVPDNPPYDAPLFNPASSSAAVAPSAANFSQRIAQQSAAQKKALRIGVNVYGPDANVAESAARALRSALGGDAIVLAPGSGGAERMVNLIAPGIKIPADASDVGDLLRDTPDATKWRVVVSGGEWEMVRRLVRVADSEKNAAAIVTGEVTDYLRLQALTKRLFALSEKAAKAAELKMHLLTALPVGPALLPAGTPLEAGYRIQYNLTPPAPGYLFGMERHGDKGRVQIIFPALYVSEGKSQADPYETDGSKKIAKMNITSDQPVGPVTARWIFLSQSANLPALPASDVAAFDRALLSTLQSVIKLTEENPSFLSAADVHYVVRHSSARDKGEMP